MRLANGPQSTAGDAYEGDAAAVGRPFGLAVGIGAGVEIAQRLRGRIVHANEAMVAAVAHESEVRAIGRPDRSRALAARLEHPHCRVSAIDRRPPELAVADESDARAPPARRDGRRVTLADLTRCGAVQRHDPQVLLRAVRVERRIGVFAGAVGAVSTHVNNGGCVRRPGEIPQFLAIVRGVRGDLAGLITRRLGQHDVADTFGIGDPRHLAAGGRGGQCRGKSRAENLIEGERRRLRGCAQRNRQNGEGSHVINVTTPGAARDFRGWACAPYRSLWR